MHVLPQRLIKLINPDGTLMRLAYTNTHTHTHTHLQTAELLFQPCIFKCLHLSHDGSRTRLFTPTVCKYTHNQTNTCVIVLQVLVWICYNHIIAVCVYTAPIAHMWPCVSVLVWSAVNKWSTWVWPEFKVVHCVFRMKALKIWFKL